MLFTMTVFQYILLYLTMYSILSKLAAIRSLTAMAVCVFYQEIIPLINQSIKILLILMLWILVSVALKK